MKALVKIYFANNQKIETEVSSWKEYYAFRDGQDDILAIRIIDLETMKVLKDVDVPKYDTLYVPPKPARVRVPVHLWTPRNSRDD